MAPARRALVLLCSSLVVACLDTSIDIDETLTAAAPMPSASSSTGAPTSSTSGAPTTSTTTDTTTTSTTGEVPGSTGSSGSTGEFSEPPLIDEVQFPAQILATGPAELVVFTHHTMTARAELDGAPIEMTLKEYGNGAFRAYIPIYASPIEVEHALTVFAESDGFPADTRTVKFTVKTPKTGSLAWERFGPPGSATRGLATNDIGAVFEVGEWVVDGVARPTIQLRNALNGDPLWPEGPHLLDDREGRAVAVAATTEHEAWVAMNVRDGGNWLPRIVRRRSDGEARPDIELDGAPGSTITAIAGTVDGGCIAVGYGTSPMGDSDVRIWRLAANGDPIVSGQAWDYAPKNEKHTFSDFAFAVAVDGDIAWIAGASRGKHEFKPEVRGMILRVDVDTTDLVAPAIIAPALGTMTQSSFAGATLITDGLLVTGTECNDDCSSQRLALTHYSAAGVRTPQYVDAATQPVATGASVARNLDGVSLVAANRKPGAAVQGSMLGHASGNQPLFEVALPGQTSEAAAAAAGPYGWMFWGGSITANQVRRAYVAKLHP